MMFPRRVATSIRLHQIFQPGERVVVAVSGGPDSLALLAVLREIIPVFFLHLTVAHFDHAWRPSSPSDTDFVRSLAARWGIDFRTARAAGGAPHTEDAARAARYAFLRQAAAATSSSAIALGHTQDDQVETMLLHLLRGSGSRGLSAMRRRDGDLARPLLDVSRHDIEAYLTGLRLNPLRDPTNEDPRFRRNRLRQQLLPALDAFDPAARHLLAQTADILSEEDRLLEAQIADLPQDIVKDREGFVRLPPALQRRIIRHLVPGASFLEVEARRRANAASNAGSNVVSNVASVAEFATSATLLVKSCSCDPAGFRAKDQVGHLDADLIRLPLRVTHRQPGDRMRPLGLAQAKRLQDILVDARVPRHLRDSLPVISDSEEIVWIPGVAVAETKRVTSATRRQLHLEMGHR